MKDRAHCTVFYYVNGYFLKLHISTVYTNYTDALDFYTKAQVLEAVHA